MAFAGLMAGVLSGVIPAERAFEGFGHPAVMVVALILIATAGLVRSGAVAWLTRHLGRADRPVALHIAVVGGVGALLSGFFRARRSQQERDLKPVVRAQLNQASVWIRARPASSRVMGSMANWQHCQLNGRRQT